MRLRRFAWLAIAAAGFAWQIGHHLDQTPGLHGDEAWFGLRAERMLAGNDLNLHGVNSYTGALFPWLLSGWFRVAGISVLSLRVVGVACNVAAAVLLVAQACSLTRRLGGAAIACALLASSVLFTTESRLAWEVTALNPLLAVALVSSALGRLGRRDPEDPDRAGWGALVVLTVLGTYNHFIFGSLVLGLFLASLACAMRWNDVATRKLLLMSAVALADAVALVALKTWLYHPPRSLPAAVATYLGIVGLEPLVLPWLARRIDDPLRRALAHSVVPFRVAAWLFALVSAWAFGSVHLQAFFQTLSNDALFKRLYAVWLPWPLLVCGNAYAALLLGTYLVTLGRSVHGSLRVRVRDYFLLVLPIGVMAMLPVMVQSNSIRYYILLNLVLMLAVVAACGCLGERGMRRMLWLTGTYALMINAESLPLQLNPGHYAASRPRTFMLGHSLEQSAHFFPVVPALDQMRTDGVRAFRTHSASDIGMPLQFYLSFVQWPARSHDEAVVEYDDARPGGLVYQVGPPAPPAPPAKSKRRRRR